MSSSFDNLSDLAHDAQRAYDLLEVIPTNSKKAFFELKDLINKLQTTCPNHPAVIEARIRWYHIALVNFESHFVQGIEGHALPPDSTIWKDEDTVFFGHNINGLFVGVELLNDYMRRSYLKQDFATFYTKLRNLYHRVYVCPFVPAKIGDLFYRMLKRLDEDLLNGKL